MEPIIIFKALLQHNDIAYAFYLAFVAMLIAVLTQNRRQQETTQANEIRYNLINVAVLLLTLNLIYAWSASVNHGHRSSVNHAIYAATLILSPLCLLSILLVDVSIVALNIVGRLIRPAGSVSNPTLPLTVPESSTSNPSIQLSATTEVPGPGSQMNS